jgi:hypothetical protein
MTWFSKRKQKLLTYIGQLTLFSLLFVSFCGNHPSINIMGPLLVGNPNNTDQKAQEQAWSELHKQLQTAKAAGVDAVSTDIWWGLVEKNGPGKYDWSFYDRLIEIIHTEGFHWIPILSFHQLGGNVGDVGNMPLPDYIWKRFQKDPTHFFNEDGLKFKSEQDHSSSEYVSFWATPLIREDLERFMINFKEHFAKYAGIVDEINISLGPSGELRYPSYNQHDLGISYPSRGAIQAYSVPAILGFREAMKNKYGSLESLKKSWGFSLQSFDQIFPPNPELLRGPFWKNKEHFSKYGMDFFDYYNEVLVKHGLMMLSMAENIFGEENSPFRFTALGGKVPSIHWRISSDRLAELSAGLIRTSYPDWTSLNSGFGYNDTLRVFEEQLGGMSRILTFTAVEMSDHRDDYLGAESRAKTLVDWLGRAAHAKKIEIVGENALGNNLSDSAAWQNITDSIFNNQYTKITLLRLNEIASDARRLQFLRTFHEKIQSLEVRCQDVLNGL